MVYFLIGLLHLAISLGWYSDIKFLQTPKCSIMELLISEAYRKYIL